MTIAELISQTSVDRSQAVNKGITESEDPSSITIKKSDLGGISPTK